MKNHAQEVPFHLGTIAFKNVLPGARGNGWISSGRWVMSSLSTVPYCLIDLGAFGQLNASWGDAIEIPEGMDAVVTNGSAHAGDILFNAVGNGVGTTSIPPKTVTMPADLFNFPSDAAPTFLRTRPIDTRRARAAFLQFIDIQPVPPGLPILPYTIVYNGTSRGRIFNPLAPVKQNLTYSQTAVGYLLSIPLGIGSGQNRESGPGANTLPEVRPMAMLDSLFVQFTTVAAAAVGMFVTSDAYYVLEY
jgi:hypothetical protein